MKRFQECNWLEKLFRYRWYLLVPIKWLWYTLIQKFKVYDHNELDLYIILVGRNLWDILVGEAQIKMKWTYTREEVMGFLKNRRKDV